MNGKFGRTFGFFFHINMSKVSPLCAEAVFPEFEFEKELQHLPGHSCVTRGKFGKTSVIVKSGSDETDSYDESIAYSIIMSHPHENLLEPLGMGSNGKWFHIALPDMGMDLLEFIWYNRSYTASAKGCRDIFSKIVKGLHHLHKLGMVHTDIKPENVFVDLQGNVKIGDFGSAHFLEEGVVHADYEVTTLWYRPLDIILQRGRPFTEALDIWSLGCLLACMWLGEPLFQQNTEPGMVKAITGKLGGLSEYEKEELLPSKYSAFCRKDRRPTLTLGDEGGFWTCLCSNMLYYTEADRPTTSDLLEILGQ
ncbi:serine/threonine protein kinase [Cannes 8 virus]|nr:serine/threonine protein kinase [Cannes 8 virus]